jgi:hypothetical protein
LSISLTISWASSRFFPVSLAPLLVRFVLAIVLSPPAKEPRHGAPPHQPFTPYESNGIAVSARITPAHRSTGSSSGTRMECP